MAQFKYLFKALLKDGSLIEQNQEDRGSVEGRNCFYDVLQKMDQLRAFALYNQETGEEWLVDLNDGHFEHNLVTIDGQMTKSGFKLHGSKEYENVRLVWFINRQLILDVVNTTIQSNEVTAYNFGWQANLKSTGENHEFVISLV
jgi:hypothetical protein